MCGSTPKSDSVFAAVAADVNSCWCHQFKLFLRFSHLWAAAAAAAAACGFFFPTALRHHHCSESICSASGETASNPNFRVGLCNPRWGKCRWNFNEPHFSWILLVFFNSSVWCHSTAKPPPPLPLPHFPPTSSCVYYSRFVFPLSSPLPLPFPESSVFHRLQCVMRISTSVSPTRLLGWSFTSLFPDKLQSHSHR